MLLVFRTAQLEIIEGTFSIIGLERERERERDNKRKRETQRRKKERQKIEMIK